MTATRDQFGDTLHDSQKNGKETISNFEKVNEHLKPGHLQNISEPAVVEIERKSSHTQHNPGIKKIEPQSPFEFLDAFYRGRIKALSEVAVRRIKSNTIALDSEHREALLRLALNEDVILDKSRKLMLIGIKLDELKPLGELLINFAAEVITEHSKIKSNGIQAKLFPGFLDEFTLDDAWAALERLKMLPDNKLLDAEVISPSSQGGGSNVVNAKKSNKLFRRSGGNRKLPMPTADRTYRNVYLCSVIWRIHKKQTSFADSMRAMRSSIFRAQRNVVNEDELLESIALMPEKEDLNVALIWDWQVRQQTELVARLNFSAQEVERLKVEVERAEGEKKAQLEVISILRQEATQSQAIITKLTADIGVVKTHGNADQENLRASSLKTISGAITNIENVVTALGRDPPKTEIAIGVLNAVLDGCMQVRNQLQGLNT